ncbi:hypothetical protein [Rhodococcus triatomae]
MSTESVVWIVVAVIAVLIVAALVVALLRRRTAQRRDEAERLRTDAHQKSFDVGREEALAEERAARARIAAAEADAKQAQADRLRKEAGAAETEAAASRADLDAQWQRADEIDPGVRHRADSVDGETSRGESPTPSHAVDDSVPEERRQYPGA